MKLLLYFLIVIKNILANYEVKFVWTAFRHGARVSNNVKKGKDQLGFDWDLENGELTSVGIRQHYILGLRQRERYSTFLDKNIIPGEVYILSTDFNRTIMSAMSHFQGLYSSGQTLTKEQNEISFPPSVSSDDSQYDFLKEVDTSLGNGAAVAPIHIISDGSPFYEINKKKYCAGIPEMKDEYPEGHKRNINDLLSKREETLKDKFGILVDHDNVNAVRMELYELADTYISAYFYGQDIAGKYFNDDKKEALDVMNDFTIFFGQDLTWGTYGEEGSYKARVTKSRLMRLVLKYLKERKEMKKSKANKDIYTNTNPKMVIYSIHDRDLAEMMVLFKYAFGTLLDNIPFASFYNIELLYKEDAESEEERWFVRVIYNDKEILLLSFDDFNSTLSAVLISDKEIDEFCTPKVISSKTAVIISIIVLSILLLGLLAFIVSNYFIFTAAGEKQENLKTEILSTDVAINDTGSRISV